MIISSETAMKDYGASLGRLLRGGECLELIGDVGSGKTTFTKGLAEGLEIEDDVQSPSFTISRIYPARHGLSMVHYDFYRLSEPGVMSYELRESLEDSEVVSVIEWAETVADVLPPKRIKIHFAYLADENHREVAATIPPELSYMSVSL